MDIWINKNTERSIYYVVLGALLFGCLTLLPEFFRPSCKQESSIMAPELPYNLPPRTFEGLGG